MQFRFLSFLVILSLFTACGIHKAPKKSRAVSPAPPSKPGRGSGATCATATDTSLDPERKIQRKTIDLKMEMQRVVRKDCTGTVISDKKEKVTFPTAEVTMQSLTQATRVTGGFPNELFNRTTCTGRGAEWSRLFLNLLGVGLLQEGWDVFKEGSTGFARMRFSVDTSPTSGGMHVRKNSDNYIDYQIKYCIDRAPNDAQGRVGECKAYATLEKGTIILTVNYSEDLDKPGVKEIQDSTCKPKP